MSRLGRQPGALSRVGGAEGPAVAAQNIVQGRIFDSGINPANLTVDERQTLADLIKKQTPNNAVLDTVLDIALDPWVLVGLGMSLPFKIPRVDRLFEASPLVGAQVRKYGSLLQNLRFSTGLQSFRGTSLGEATGLIERTFNGFRKRMAALVGDDFRAFTALRTSQGLRVQRLSDSRVDDIALALFVGGRHKEQTTAIPRIVFKALDKEGVLKKISKSRAERLMADGRLGEIKTSIETSTQRLPAVVGEQELESFIDRRGLRPLADSLRRAYDTQLRLRYGTAASADTAAPFVLDEAKLLREFRGARNQFVNGSLSKDGARLGVINGLLQDGVLDQVHLGVLSEDQYLTMVRSAFQRQANYHPLNLPATFRAEAGGLRRLSEDEVSAAARVLEPRFRAASRARGVLRSGLGSAPKGFGSLAFNPEDLELLRREAPTLAGAGLDSAIAQGRKAALKAERLGKPVRFWDLSADRSFVRSVDDNARGFALYTTQPSAEVLEAQRKRLGFVKKLRELEEPGISKRPEFMHDAGLGKGRRSFFDVAQGGKDAPAGGFSIADVVRSEGSLIRKTNPARDHLLHVILPMVTGRSNVQQGVLTGAALKLKQFTKGVMDSGLRDVLNTAGLTRVSDTLGRFGDRPFTEKRFVDRELANFIYGSTLGANIGSVLLNMSQPLSTTSGLVRIDDLALGFVDALKDMKRYAQVRVRLGGTRLLVGPASRPLKRQILKEAFGDLADTLELSDDALDAVERIGSRAFALGERRGPFAVLDRTNETLLKLFEKGEFFNRLTTARSIERLAKRQGITGDALRAVQRRAIQETQFSSSISNTSLLFLPDQRSLGTGPLSQFFNQPLFRQFMTFTLRMAMLPFQATRFGAAPSFRRSLGLAARRLAGLGPDEVQRALGPEFTALEVPFSGLQFTGRALVTSMVAYHVGKNLLGVDLTPGTLVGAASQGFNAREGTPFSPFPAPPALSVPVQLVRGIAGGDVDELGRALPLLVPGGLAVARALQAAPRAGVLADLRVQKRFADYSKRDPQGRVDVVSADGRLIERMTPLAIAARAAGLDLGKFRDESEALRVINKQRDLKSEFTRRWLQAVQGNDLDRAQRIEGEFKRRFGYRLQVTRAALASFKKGREETRIERALKRLAEADRAPVQAAVARALGERVGLDPATGTPVGGDRPVDPETEARLEEAMQRLDDARARFEQPVGGSGPFQSFSSP